MVLGEAQDHQESEDPRGEKGEEGVGDCPGGGSACPMLLESPLRPLSVQLLGWTAPRGRRRRAGRLKNIMDSADLAFPSSRHHQNLKHQTNG